MRKLRADAPRSLVEREGSSEPATIRQAAPVSGSLAGLALDAAGRPLGSEPLTYYDCRTHSEKRQAAATSRGDCREPSRIRDR